jgi:hypothetical protein
MRFKYIILYCLLSVLIVEPFRIFAQHDKEVGVLLALTQYNGDLTNANGFSPRDYGGAIIFRYYFNPRIDFKANVFYGYISGSDWQDNPHIAGIPYNRNLSFKSHILDISTQIEINILPFISGHRKRNWSPYIFGGIAVFNFNPQAEYLGKWYDLQPLGTEGQGTLWGGPKYKLTAFSIPYGIGFKYGFKRSANWRSLLNLEMWNIGIELSQRKTFTDHLDDVGGYYPESLSVFGTNDIAKALCDRSGEVGAPPRIKEGQKFVPRGNSAYNDYYMWYGITITKTFRPTRCKGF